MSLRMMQERGHWSSKIGFILAAAGSAVGLGNIWKFPYITGENGGGAFVLIYLLCIALVGLPVMMAEVLIGRMAQRSTVGSFQALAGEKSIWTSVGWLGVVTGIVILSYYSVVAGWSLHYVWLSIQGTFSVENVASIKAIFGNLYVDTNTNVFWHLIFMLLTALIVLGGVKQGVERAARILMPLLLLMLATLAIYASSLDGFASAVDFVFGFHTDALTPAGVLEALGHSFFTLSVGMGAMLTYGSYLSKNDDLVTSSIAITVLDTLVALMACLVLFPITFTKGMEPAAGPGLVFENMPMAFTQLPGGNLWAFVFFLLLAFAALTSSISLLEVAAAYLIDERKWPRKKAVAVISGFIFLLGIPSALSGGTKLFGEKFATIFGYNWFDTFDKLASNWLLPLGGLGISLFVAWKIADKARRASVAAGSTLGKIEWFYLGWLQLLRFVVPVGIVLVMLYATGVFKS